MAKVLQHRRGTTAEHSNFTGAAGEITFDTTDKRLVAHDGTTKGGIPMAKKSDVDAIDVGVTSFNGSKGAVTYSAPVSSVNGQTGAVSVDVGVTSFNGSKGAVTYSAPVSSVNGQTGAVTVDVGVTSVNGKTGAVTGLVTSVNGTVADESGNVNVSVSPAIQSERPISVGSTKSYTVPVSGLLDLASTNYYYVWINGTYCCAMNGHSYVSQDSSASSFYTLSLFVNAGDVIKVMYSKSGSGSTAGSFSGILTPLSVG